MEIPHAAPIVGPAPAAHVVQCRDGALKTRTVSVQIRPWAPPRVAQCRGVPLKPERLQVQVLPRGPIWNVHRSSAPGLFAKQCVPSGKWCKSTAFRHSCARSSKRAGGFIPRIALDQCRDPERYRTCAPFRTSERTAAPATSMRGDLAGERDRPGVLIFVPIAQNTERARPKRQVAGESPAGDTISGA